MHETLLKTAGKEFFIYADDSNLMSTSLQKIRCMLHAIQPEGEMYGFKIKTSDAFLIRAGNARHLPPPALKDFHGIPIPEKAAASTLGYTLSALSSTEKLIKERSAAMLTAMKQYKLIWRAHLPLKRIIQKYFALVMSKATHGLQVVAITDDQFSGLEHTHSRCLRRILGIKAAFINHISNAEVLRRAGVHSIRFYIRKFQYEFLGKILQLPHHHPDRLIIFQPNDDLVPRVPQLPFSTAENKRRKRGRPRTTWISTLLPALRATFSNREIIDLARTPHRWSQVTSRLCTDVEHS
jgi:hypothetical protein